MNLQIVQQKKCMTFMLKIQIMVKEMKIVQALNLRQKLLYQVFEIIQMHIFL